MQLVFAPNSDTLAATTQFLVQGALQQWLGDLLRIDHALRNNPEFRANGDLVNVNDYTAKASQIFDGAITELQNSIGTMKDIDNIILVGGGATYLQPILQKSFPKHPIILVEDPLFSIVRGLHLAGEQFATAQQRKTA